MTRIAMTLGTILIPSVATAHPAHGSGGNFGVLHFLSDPFHVGLTAVVIVVAIAARLATLRRRDRDQQSR